MNHCQAVRLELLDEKAALHQERVMKDQAATQPCSRLQAAALRPRTSASLCPFSSSTRLLSSVPYAGYLSAAAARERSRRLARVMRGAGTLRCSSEGWRRGRATQALARLRQRELHG